jgi:hypothetical protein
MKVENMQVRAANGVCVWVPLPRRRCSDTAHTHHAALGVDARVYGVFRSVPTLVTLSLLHRGNALCTENDAGHRRRRS